MRSCDVVLKDSIDGKLGIIADSLRENYMMIGLALIVLLLCIALIWMLVSNIIGIVRTYQRFTRRTEASIKLSATKDAPEDVISMQVDDMLAGMKHGDDYGAVPVTDAELIQEPVSEREAVQKKISEIKNVYADYNKEITKYSQDVLQKDPDDVVDERILGKDDDVYAS